MCFMNPNKQDEKNMENKEEKQKLTKRIERTERGFCRYYLDDLAKDYPFSEGDFGKKRDFCIDGMGRNHHDSPVYIKLIDMNNKSIQEKQKREKNHE